VCAPSVLLCLVLTASLAFAQTGPTVTPLPPQPDEGSDSDPTRPVVWSLREEFYGASGSWSNVFIFRSDRAFLRERGKFGNRRGILTRFDVPVAVANRRGETQGGLGDLYAQAFLIPHLTQKFALAAGSGFIFPTATDRLLGNGKFLVAPVIAPVWFVPRHGFFLLKLQDFISVAGDGVRPDLHYFTTTPLLVWRVRNKPYWVQLDGETKTNFTGTGQSGYKAGLLLGRMFARRGVWVKAEVFWGPARDANFAIKTSFFKVR
jgi:hypothetical protein